MTTEAPTSEHGGQSTMDAPTPLDGVRVIELGSLIAGPFCGQLLADYGAEVIKVEDPKHGDPMRKWGVIGPGGVSLSWQVIARNKRSITCDLRTEAGQGLIRRLVAKSDVMVENFRPGTLERWRLDFATLSAINPRLVLVRVTGFGQDGPYAARAGFGSIGEAMGGLRYITGEPDRPPSRIGISIGDSLAGTFSAMGTLLALRARERTGRGQVVDTAIYEAVLTMMEALLPEWALGGHRRERTGSTLPGVAPSNLYLTGSGDTVLISANLDSVFRRLCAALDQDEMADDPRFATHQARGRHMAELDDLIERWTSVRDTNAVLRIMHEHGIPAGRVFTAAEMFEDPHIAARNTILFVDDPRGVKIPMQNVSPRLSHTPGSVRAAAPDLGADNGYVFKELLGYSDGELSGLKAAGVI